ncbi:integral membrane protein [Seiridium cupressi]
MFSPQIAIETGMQRALIVIPILFGLLAITAVRLRVLARHIVHRRLDASDYTMIAALVVNVSFCGIVAAEPFTGRGIHLHDLAARFGTAPVITYTKVWHLKGNWRALLTDTHAQMTIANQILWALAITASLSVVLDVAVLILPMPYLLTLQLALMKKPVLVATFAAGLILRC